jgi:mannose-6-phosphate isomerase-like protein (cupin superfamily)
VLQAGDRFENPRTGASLEVLRAPARPLGLRHLDTVSDVAASYADPPALELRWVLKPHTGKAVPHAHLDFVERFVVEAGNAVARVAGAPLELAARERLEIPVGARHVNPYNVGTKDLIMRHAVEPATDFTLGFFETLGYLMRAGRVDRQGQTPLAAAFAVAHATRSQTYAAALPRWLQRRMLFPIGTWLARLRHYELRLPGD